ncbi:MAG: superfamily II DNA or RNA helicase [Oleiphilaceae bacterium]|jgi:superfamily II DNA or RNA helicase
MRVKGSKINDVLWVGLRKCQQESIGIALSYLKKPVSEKSCLLSLPTGAGKSGVITMLAHIAKHKRVLILCHRSAVKNQLVEQLSGDFFSMLAKEETVPSKPVFASVDESEVRGIYVSTFQKLQMMERVSLQQLKENIDLLIIDEGHSEPSPVWSQLVRGIGAHKIIVTATPYRNDLFQFDIDPKASYMHTFEKALADGILIEPEFSKVDSNTLVAAVTQLMQRQPGTKCIVKCKEFRDIEHYLAIFSPTLKTLAIHEQYKNNKRNNVKVSVPKKIAESDWEVIVHQRKLDEGIDIPQAKILVLTYPVSSGRELVQTVGRVVRLYNDYGAYALEIQNESNKRMWDNYREFDTYISNSGNAHKFLTSLDTAGLIDSYLEAFPDVSYFQSGYKRKFNLKSFDPEKSLVIPLASVCFIQKDPGFSLASMIDRMYWNFTRDGELVEHRQDHFGSEVLLSVAFSNSKFLRDELFFEPSFEVFIAKEVGDFVAVFDSRSRNFSFEKDLLLGAAVSVDKLIKLANRSDKTRTKEAHTKAISSAARRPEGVTIRGSDLERMVTPQGNSSYVLTTLKVDNLSNFGKKESSYYLGVSSGRVSDQKKRNFTLEELCEWIDDIDTALDFNVDNRSSLINSYAKSVYEYPESEPLSILIDFTEHPAEIHISKDGAISCIDNNFIFFDYEGGISPLSHDTEYKLMLEVDKDKGLINFVNEVDLPFIFGEGDRVDGHILSLFNSATFKVLYPDGMSYLDGQFYRVNLPSEQGFEIDEMKLGGAMIPFASLLGTSLNEKDDRNVQPDSFGQNSIFFLIDKLKDVVIDDATLDHLGDFYNYIPDIDLALCADMGTEPADFILSSASKLVFVHVKCGKTTNPQSSAGAIAEVGGQAIKNLEMLISHNSDLFAANRTRLLGKWPTDGTENGLEERIRLINKQRFSNNGNDDNLRGSKLDEAWETIANRRRSAAVQKEIWVVVGNAFSRGHFVSQMRLGNQAQAESLQAYQLIDSWMATTASADVALKFFVSP